MLKLKKDSQIFLTIALAASVFIAGAIVHDVARDIHQYHTWKAERQIIEITVSPGDTLYAYAGKYKPTWMDPRDYCESVKELNNMSTSTLQAFQNIKIYI